MDTLRGTLRLLGIPFFCLLAVALLFAVQPSVASPTQTAPSGNPASPINVSATSQTKTGPLTVQNTLTAPNATVSGALSSNTVCLSGSCVNSWPSASYSTPNIHQVIDQGAYAPNGFNFANGVGFQFGYSGWSNSGYRSTWPTPYVAYSSCYSKSTPYLTWTYCNGNDLMYGVNRGGPTIYCCSLNAYTY